MKDVQSQRDTRNVALKKVGIKNLKWPICVLDRAEKIQHTTASIDVSVDLPHDIRGTHMSRFVEVVSEMENVLPKNLEATLDKLKERLQSNAAQIKIDFDYFIKKPSPVTGIISPIDVKCSFEAEKGDEFKFLMGVSVPITTLCPCSKEISEFGAHNQRAIVDIKLEMKSLIWIEEIVAIAEACGSSPVYSLLKRQDEKWVTEQSYLNPRFVEDAVREAVIRLEANSKIKWYSVSVESIESIHNHSAFAYAEKGCII